MVTNTDIRFSLFINAPFSGFARLKYARGQFPRPPPRKKPLFLALAILLFNKDNK